MKYEIFVAKVRSLSCPDLDKLLKAAVEEKARREAETGQLTLTLDVNVAR